MLLAAELDCEALEPMWRSEIAELIGSGYDDLKGRTIRRHKQNVLAEIRLQVGDDLLKQQQLAEAVALNYSQAKKTATAEEEMKVELADLVIEGIIDLLRTINQKKQAESSSEPRAAGGRLPHHLKIAREVVQAGVVNTIPAGKVAAVARMLKLDRDQLRVAQKLYDDFKSGDAPNPYSAAPPSCNGYPEKYEKVVRDLWQAGTRGSEKKSDDIRNPADRSDKKLYRKRFLDNSIPYLCDWMNKRGREMLRDEDFA